jgi:putative serine/threonine protein kinase
LGGGHCPGTAQLARIALEPGEARQAVCYPDPGSRICDLVVSELERLGLRYIPYGPVEVGGSGLRLLGKGWAGNVFLAHSKQYGIVAVKALRPGSRRQSMAWEATAWAAASELRVAPQLLAWSRVLIAYKPVIGPLLSDYKAEQGEALAVLDTLMVKVFLLDLIGLANNELARPGGQVVLDTCGHNPPEPFIVDYDSATYSRKPSNLTQLLGGLHRIPLYQRCRPLPRILREPLAAYKTSHTPTLFSRIRRVALARCVTLLQADHTT